MITLDRVTKTWAENGVRACDTISWTIAGGQVIALLGENGAGKSTLVSLIAGLQELDSGTITVDGVPLSRQFSAKKARIFLVPQHPPLAPELSLAQNALVGQSSKGWWKPGYRQRWTRVFQTLAQQWNFALDWSKPGRLAAAVEIQRVALVTQFLRQPRLLILDEPTAALPQPEAAALLGHLRDWTRSSGGSVLLITHKLDEALLWCDKIAVLRRGQLVAEVRPSETDAEQLGRLLFPERDTDLERGPTNTPTGVVVWERRGTASDFVLHRGEILGLTSLQGEGTEALEEELTGFQPLEAGRHLLLGDDVTNLTIRELRQRGLSYVPSDRMGRGSSPLSALVSNLIPHRAGSLSRKGLLPRRSVWAWFHALQSRYNLSGEAEQRLITLSGGTIQKGILAREIEHGPRVLILAEPAWGLDRAARNVLWSLVRDAAAQGTAVVVLTTDPLELLENCHRVGALRSGALRALRPVSDWNADQLGRVLLGLER